MSTYSNRIRELRKNKSLSQEQLADKLGVTKQAVSQMERGARCRGFSFFKKTTQNVK